MSGTRFDRREGEAHDALRRGIYLVTVVLATTALGLLPITRTGQRGIVDHIREAVTAPRVTTLTREDGFDLEHLHALQRQSADAVVCPAPERPARLRAGDREITARLVGLDLVGDPRLASRAALGPARLSELRRPTILLGAHVPGLGAVRPGAVIEVWVGEGHSQFQVSSLRLPVEFAATGISPVVAVDIARFLDVDPEGRRIDRVDIVPFGSAPIDPLFAERLASWHGAWEAAGMMLNGGGFVVGLWVLVLGTVSALRRQRRRIATDRELGVSARRAFARPVAETLLLGTLGTVLGGLNAKLLGSMLVGVVLPVLIGDAYATTVRLEPANGPLAWAFVCGVVLPVLWVVLTWRDRTGRSPLLVVSEARPAMAGILLSVTGLLFQPGHGRLNLMLLSVAASLLVIALALLAQPAFVLLARALRRLCRRRFVLEGRLLSAQIVEPDARLGVSLALLFFTFAAYAAGWTMTTELRDGEHAWSAIALSVDEDATRAAVTRASDVAWRATVMQAVSFVLLVLAAAAGIGPSALHDVPRSWRAFVAWGISRRRVARAALAGQVVLTGVVLLLGGTLGVVSGHLAVGVLGVPVPGGAFGPVLSPVLAAVGFTAWIVVALVATGFFLSRTAPRHLGIEEGSS